MQTSKLMIAVLSVGLAGSSAILRGQGATPDQAAKPDQDVLQQLKEDHQQLEQLKQRVSENEKKLSDAQTAAETAPSEEAAATRHLTIAGGADVTYQRIEGEHGSFALSHFSPVLLYRASDKVLAEAEMEMQVLDNGDTEVGIEYAQIDYLFNDYVTLIAGRFTLPIAVVREKLDAGWINKLPIQPLPEADATAIIPENDVGVQARGGVPLGEDLRLTYAAYLVNGPGEDDTGNIAFNAGADANGSPSGGGRLALLYPPAAHQDVEVGVSGQTGSWSKEGNHQWSASAVDAAVHLNEYTEFRGEYIKTWQETYTEGTQDREGWWAQAAYKLAALDLDLPMINSVEVVLRYSGLQLPEGHANQYTSGLNYHINNTLIVKAAYAVGQSNTVDADGKSLDSNQLLFQVAYGF